MFSMYAQAATIRAVSPDALEISYNRPVTDKQLSQSTARKQQLGPSFAARSGRGHIPQLSITDDSHHVTEAIGGMYDDEEEHDGRRESRPVNYSSPTTNGGPVSRQPLPERSAARGSLNRKQLQGRDSLNGGPQQNGSEQRRPSMGRARSWEQENGHTSPTLGLRERQPSDTATTHFPLTDIDYESSPAAVAQELSNLHALRRMSMDVAAQGDPDLPSLSPAAMPSAPSHSDSEDDSARLFWVPARLHPELAPQEFKSFLNGKAEQIKRRSGELSQFSTSPSSSRSSSLSFGNGGLQRKKSMLSRQIESPIGYQDGAERLERKRSLSSRNVLGDPNLEELETLVSEGSPLQRLSLESPVGGENGDIILPSVPGNTLKRSTRTTYNRGGSRKGRGDRTTYAQRAARRTVGGDQVSPQSPHVSDIPPLPTFSSEIVNLASTLRDPSAGSTKATTNFSRPGRSPSPPQSVSSASIGTTLDDIFAKDDVAGRSSISSLPSTSDRQTFSSYQDRPSSNLPRERQEIPQIIEVPPPDEPLSRASTAPTPSPQAYFQNNATLPERTSSREAHRDDARTSSTARPGMPQRQGSPVLAHKRPPSRGGNVSGGPQQARPGQSLEQMSSHPSPLPGNDTNTGNLSFIPTLTEDKRADSKKIKDKKEEGKKSGWGWLIGKDEEKEKKSEGGSSKPKAKITKPPEKYDNTRLDVLQSSIDGGSGKGRESIVLDRANLQLEEERKKESQRKSVGSDMKKEKEGLFSSFFGGKKSKAEKDNTTRKHHSRGLSPEPPYRELKPDIDYNWTRFSILEERAIYRMAHIKLANPRRALYSQVLLSNFMYSYLAKVQQMHPQMNLPTSAKAQKKQQQQQAQPQAKQQPDEFTQYQRYQQQQGQQHVEQPVVQPDAQSYGPQQEYEDDTSMYEYDKSDHRPRSRGSKQHMENGNNSGASPSGQPSHGYTIQHGGSQRQTDEDEMW